MDAITVYGTDSCEDTQRTRQHLEELEQPYRYINVDDNGFASDQVKNWNAGKRLTPTVVLNGRGRETRLAVPSNEELDREIGLLGIRPKKQWGELAK